jgi:outer membrane protein OmpA-like peptidoglycan-associated protein
VNISDHSLFRLKGCFGVSRKQLFCFYALLLSFFLTANLRLCAQELQGFENLVPNGSFEDRLWCPSNFTQTELKTLRHWRQPNSGTPDHFSSCGVSGVTGVPNNVFGSQGAVDGSGYAGVVLYSSSKPDYREYLQVELTRTLNRGEWICAEWWVCAADEAQLITDGVGMHFSSSAPRGIGEGRLELEAQVANPALHMLSDRWSWVKLSDVFRAEGGERYLTLGNFLPAAHLRVMERQDASPQSSRWAYVYIDDVRVRSVVAKEDCSCLNPLLAKEVTDPPWQTYQIEHVRWEAVLFEFDSDVLGQEAELQLEIVAEEMRTNRFLVIEVNGHADYIGSDGYNLLLSERRAQSVIQSLRERGVDPNRLKIAYHGSVQPAANNETSAGRQKNRRVEFELLEHAFLPSD